MSNEFDLDRFKAGESAYCNGQEYTFVGFCSSKTQPLVIEAKGGCISTMPIDGVGAQFRLTMKPKVKKVDWSKMPVDTMINTPHGINHFSHYQDDIVCFFSHGSSFSTYRGDGFAMEHVSKLSLCDSQPWTFWQGGECPIPDGLEFEIVYRIGCTSLVSQWLASKVDWEHHQMDSRGRDSDIIAYRLTGKIMEGWEL